MNSSSDNWTLSTRNVLVTGANGQLGSELRELASTHPDRRFFFTDWQDLDITDAEAVKRYVDQNGIDVIINAAAYTAVDKAESEPDLAEAINHHGAGNLAEAAGARGALLIHVSTDYVFDGAGCTPYTETMPANPLGVYGETKLRGEQAVLASGARAVIIRTAWLYSSFGNNFVKTMLRLGRERETLGVVVDQIGTPTYARDLALAILSVVSAPRPGIYHYCNDGVASWYDFAKAVMDISGLACDVRPIETREYPTPAKRPGFSVLSKTKIKQTYSLTIPYWRDSVRECILKLKGEQI
ncbi:MAG: dTDP-4-dehydrorhamnose reductase [Desulfobulbaceae bacterium]|nr:dTDP-4-dehydrorhamnose reductase [Desulfobulbaceae bacterium]